jgi:hypothetical protein
MPNQAIYRVIHDEISIDDRNSTGYSFIGYSFADV